MENDKVTLPEPLLLRLVEKLDQMDSDLKLMARTITDMADKHAHFDQNVLDRARTIVWSTSTPLEHFADLIKILTQG